MLAGDASSPVFIIPVTLLCQRALLPPATQGRRAARGRGRRRRRRRPGRISRSTGGARHGAREGRGSARRRTAHRSARHEDKGQTVAADHRHQRRPPGRMRGGAGLSHGRPPPLPRLFRGQTDPAEAASLADLPWWEVFRDSTLQELLADRAGPQLRPAHRRRPRGAGAGLSGQGQGRVLSRDRVPRRYQSGLARRAEVFGVPSGQAPTTESAFVGLFTASWELDIWGRIRRQHEAARAQFFATEEARRGVLLSLVSTVAQAYFELLRAGCPARHRQAEHRLLSGHLQSVPAPAGVRPGLDARDHPGGGRPGEYGREHPGPRASDRGQGERDQCPAGAESWPDPAGHALVRAGRGAGGPGGAAVRAPRAAPGPAAGGAAAGAGQRAGRRGQGQLLPAAHAERLRRRGQPPLSAFSHVWSLAAGLSGPIFQGGRFSRTTGRSSPPGSRRSCSTSRP